MTLRARLAIGLLAIAVILICPLVLALQSLHDLHENARALEQQDFAASLLLGQLRESLNDLRRQELALLFTRNASARSALEKQVNSVARMADSLERFQLPTSARDVETTVEQLAGAVPAEDQALATGNTKVADSISAARFVPAVGRADSAITVAERALRIRTGQRVSATTRAISRTQFLSGSALFLAVVLSGLIAFFLTRSISQPVEALATGMRAVADGDLNNTLPLSAARRDEFGLLAQSFQAMTQQLRELDRLKAEFVSVASHELKTPINVVIGYIQLLEDGIYGPLSEKQLDVVRTVTLQVQTLQRLVRQLLDVSRFEAGAGRIEPRKTALRPFLSQLKDAFHVLAVQREVQFRVVDNADLPEAVFWDIDRMNEVLGNLLANAFKFTPRGGTVTLSAEPVDANIVMEVADTGAGIRPDQLPHIFEKFYQASNQPHAGAGSGLGLAIAKQIVEAHGGAIQCDSTLGVGTTFTITLPVQVDRRSSTPQHLAPHAVS